MSAVMQGWREATSGPFLYQLMYCGGHVFPIKFPITRMGKAVYNDIFMSKLSQFIMAIVRGVEISSLPTGVVSPAVSLYSTPCDVTLDFFAFPQDHCNHAHELHRLLNDNGVFFIRFDRTRAFLANLTIDEQASRYRHTLFDLKNGKLEGEVHWESVLEMDGNWVRLYVDVDLSTKKGTGKMKPLEDTSGYPLP